MDKKDGVITRIETETNHHDSRAAGLISGYATHVVEDRSVASARIRDDCNSQMDHGIEIEIRMGNSKSRSSRRIHYKETGNESDDRRCLIGYESIRIITRNNYATCQAMGYDNILLPV